MKAQLQLASSALALAGLMVGVAAHATNIAELPLKMAVLAKPNIIFALDDSGSMDWELLLGTRNGYLWWDDAGSAWDGTNNRPRTDLTNNRGMAYLFPMGVGANNGGQLYNIGTDYGRVAPPIAQLAWARSSAFNPLYYNSSVNYPAWAPAYVSGALRSYSNASTTAAPSHPGPLSGTVTTLNVGSDWNSSSTNFTTANFRFSVMPGMALPVGTVVNATTSSSGVCSGGTAQTLTAVTVVPAGQRCQASIPYFPATFWQRTVCPANEPTCVVAPDCTVENPVANPNASCIASPDGVGKLRRYEIKTGNTFPSGRSAADELQNFANWFTYYRKRKLMLAGAMGRSLESITGVRMGAVAFCEDTAGNPCIAPTMFDADSTNPANNRRAVAGYFYLNAQAAEGTPTHATMKYVAGQFNTNTSVVQYACQRNSLFVMTDGFSNTATTTPPAWDAGKSANTWGATAPYQTTINGSLADLGLRYYTNRLRATGATSLPAGRVPSGDPARVNPDLNTDLHITTYGITLGARGTLYPNELNPFAI
ncbi:MAG: pyrrolo-quinoline quinone, partial [Rubrivivax sp.]|nr:pyrrolo-quinoline quinone [Rubrivivax sp.]